MSVSRIFIEVSQHERGMVAQAYKELTIRRARGIPSVLYRRSPLSSRYDGEDSPVEKMRLQSEITVAYYDVLQLGLAA